MKKPKQIPHPNLTGAIRLTALELNALRPSDKHTILTPDRLKQK